MPGKRKLLTTTIVNNYTPVHPALDFTEDKAIVSVGIQLRSDYDNGDIGLEDGALTVFSNGESFIYSKKTLADRNFYYSRSLDLPIGRWEYDDLAKFCEEIKLGNNSVGIHQVYTAIRDRIEFYMDYENPVYYDLLSCFIIYTYFYPLFSNAPIIQVWGDIKTGKSKTISLLSALCFNPINSANISESCVFRVIEGRRAVVLLDESEDLMTTERGRAICNLLLAGYSKGGETYRQEKLFKDGAYRAMSFKVFSPKVIANVAGINMPALQTRIIRLVLTGAADKTKANREVDVEDKVFQKIRNRLYRLALTSYKEVAEARDNLPEMSLTDRTLGIWQGILTIASIINKRTMSALLEYALWNAKDIQEDLDLNDSGTAIAKRLYLFVSQKGDGDYPVETLWDYIRQDENLYDITKKRVGQMMKRLGFLSRLKRDGNTVARYYDLRNSHVLARIGRH